MFFFSIDGNRNICIEELFWCALIVLGVVQVFWDCDVGMDSTFCEIDRSIERRQGVECGWWGRTERVSSLMHPHTTITCL